MRRLKELLRSKLVQSGWFDELKNHCKGTLRSPPRGARRCLTTAGGRSRVRACVRERRGDQEQGLGEDQRGPACEGDHAAWPRCAAVPCRVVCAWRRVAPVPRPDRLRLSRRLQPLSRTRLKPSCCSGYEPFCRPTSRAHSGQRAIPCSATSCFKDIPSTLYRDSWRAVARYGSHAPTSWLNHARGACRRTGL